VVFIKDWVGQRLYGYCNGAFGRRSSSDKIIEATGLDWIIARELDTLKPVFAHLPNYEMEEFMNHWLTPMLEEEEEQQDLRGNIKRREIPLNPNDWQHLTWWYEDLPEISRHLQQHEGEIRETATMRDITLKEAIEITLEDRILMETGLNLAELSVD
jgi:hypothetical protein